VVADKVGKMKEERGWNQPIWVPKEVIINMKGPQMFWVPKATWRQWDQGLGRLGTKKLWRFKPRSQACKLDICCPSSPVEVMETSTYFLYHCSSIALFRLHLLHCLHMVGCLCHVLTHEQSTWFDYCVGKLHLFFHDACLHIYIFESWASYRVSFPFVVINNVHRIGWWFKH
jgi:hypothetical protein